MKVSLPLILMDGIGAILLGLGFAEHFAGTNLVPASLQIPYYSLVMMAAGVALMLPFVLNIIRQVRNNANQGSS